MNLTKGRIMCSARFHPDCRLSNSLSSKSLTELTRALLEPLRGGLQKVSSHTALSFRGALCSVSASLLFSSTIWSYLISMNCNASGLFCKEGLTSFYKYDTAGIFYIIVITGIERSVLGPFTVRPLKIKCKTV